MAPTWLIPCSHELDICAHNHFYFLPYCRDMDSSYYGSHHKKYYQQDVAGRKCTASLCSEYQLYEQGTDFFHYFVQKSLSYALLNLARMFSSLTKTNNLAFPLLWLPGHKARVLHRYVNHIGYLEGQLQQTDRAISNDHARSRSVTGPFAENGEYEVRCITVYAKWVLAYLEQNNQNHSDGRPSAATTYAFQNSSGWSACLATPVVSNGADATDWGSAQVSQSCDQESWA